MDFLYLLLQHADLPSVCAQTGVPGLNRDRAYEIPVLLPPRAEQRRIVDLLGALDAAIEAGETASSQSSQLLTQCRNAVMASAAQPVPADDAFDILMGVQRSPSRAAGPHQVPYLRSANVSPGRLQLADVKTMSFSPDEEQKYLLLPGDVLVTEGSGSAATVGAPAAYDGEAGAPLCFQNTLLRYRSIPGVTTDRFTLHWCLSAFESGTFREAANGTNIKHIGSRRAEKLQVCLPDLARQDEITSELDTLTSVCDAAAASVASLRSLRSNILTALLSGEHEIPASYDELMEVASA